MQSISIPIHSIVDLITNSSTVIYTYSGASLEACKKLVDGFFKAFGIAKKCEDVFRLEILPEDPYDIYEWVNYRLDKSELPSELLQCEDPSRELGKLLKEFEGKEKPEWLLGIISQYLKKENGNGFTPSSKLVITPLKPEYGDIAKSLGLFLYSTTQESDFDG